jgi:hypothetical protein
MRRALVGRSLSYAQGVVITGVAHIRDDFVAGQERRLAVRVVSYGRSVLGQCSRYLSMSIIIVGISVASDIDYVRTTTVTPLRLRKCHEGR